MAKSSTMTSHSLRPRVTWIASLCIAAVTAQAQQDDADASRASAPPESFFELVAVADRDAARQFYRKYLTADGMPIVAAQEVADQALERTQSIVTHMLSGRPDISEALRKNRMYLIVIGKDQVYTDMPEYRKHPNPEYQNERVRGTGGRPTSFGEENLLSLPIDRYDDESIGVHEFCHTIDSALRSIDPAWTERKNAAYHSAMRRGLWTNTYAASNPAEFWAEICQSYFDCNRVNNWNHGPIGTREQLKAYDPESYELVDSTFKLAPEQDWRYQFLQRLPNVTPPPQRFKIDPFYTKFTWAREFSVIGRRASDASLLRANDTVRKMFAYRHDLLKALIADGARLVVLGERESVSELPEFESLQSALHVDAATRTIGYAAATKLLVVGEEDLAGGLAPNGDPVIRVFAQAIHDVAGTRPVDPNWDSRGRAVQQYELRVKRLDIRFDESLKQVYERAMEAGLWKDTAAARDRVAYWVAGVVAYFDAATPAAKSADEPRAIRTRDSLKDYDPGLFAIVHETMAYEGHEDWRMSRRN